jgi:DNA ligase-associated metallophosphoesterase
MLIDAGGVPIELLAERAAWLPASETLLVADLHLGKAQSFRRSGVPVPAGTTAAVFGRLDRLIERRAPRELIVLGDLLHGPLSQRGPAIDALAHWRARYTRMAVRMVRGNHDASAGDPPPACGIEAVSAPLMHAGLALCHEPDEPAACFRVAGHVHPVLRMRGRIDRIRVACFWVRPDALILPAFGEFTGGWPVMPQAGEQVFAVAGSDVIAVPPPRPRANGR